MWKYVPIFTMVGLLGCSVSEVPARNSAKHNYALRHTTDRALEVQECDDKMQSCLSEVCSRWQEACDVEPAYCHLETWVNACIRSCETKHIACVAK